MTVFVVEHEVKGYPMFDTVRGVEDIDLSMFTPITTLICVVFWVVNWIVHAFSLTRFRQPVPLSRYHKPTTW